ncbi:hypothetical protein KYC5002_01580 [Archangium violaceum]|uniref:hypothetical protein n=1 Tax=Archangium violaceum TaxID=83451 RepID=UPI002B31DFC4|nr:hypothetical protein KYC5002_01580 [Archangium gephyra]
MIGLYLLECSIAVRSGGRIHCGTAALIVLVFLAVRFLPGWLEESPPDPPPDAPFQNSWSPDDSQGNQTLLLVIGAVFLMGALVFFAAR